jgi:hypothetical protein
LGGWLLGAAGFFMDVALFVKRVAACLSVGPCNRRRLSKRPQVGIQSVERLEVRQVLSGFDVGPLLHSYEIDDVFNVNGRVGDAYFIDGVLYIGGTAVDGKGIVAKLDENGVFSTLVTQLNANVSGAFKQGDSVVFTGRSIGSVSGSDFTYWNDAGVATVVADPRNSNSFDVSPLGRMVGSTGNEIAVYHDVGTTSIMSLPGIDGFYLSAGYVTDNNQYIGASGYNENGNFRSIVYELVGSVYRILNDSFLTSRGEETLGIEVFETSQGVLGVAPFFNQNGSVETALFALDGTHLADVGLGYSTGVVPIGDSFIVATQGVDQGLVTVFNPAYEKRTYTATELFGSVKQFKAGSLAVTEDGDLIVIGNGADGLTVRIFDTTQDLALGQVNANSIVVPALVAGQAGNIAWGSVTGATGYELVFSRGATVVHTATTTGATFAVPTSFLAGSHTVSIRATGEAGVTAGAWSSNVAFTVKPRAVVATSISGLPAVATSSAVTVQWQAATGATSYAVTISKNSGGAQGSTEIFRGDVTTNRVTIPAGFAAAVYTVSVVSKANGVSGDNAVATFTVKQGSIDGASIAGFGAHPGAQTVTWQAVAGAAVAGVTRYEVQVTELGSSTPLVTRVVTSNAVSFTLAKTGSYRLSLRVLGSPAATHGSWVAKNFVLVLPVVPVASIQLSQTIAGVATNVAFGRVAGAVKYDLWVYSFQTQQYLLKTSLTAISHRLAAGLSAGRYRVFVRGVDDAGRAAAWSHKDVSIVPLAQVSGVAVSGLASANVAGSVAWRAVSGAVGYEVLITGAGNREVRRVSVPGVSLALPTGLAAGEFQLLVRAKNALSTGAWSVARALVVRLSPVQNLRVAAITVGEAGRVLWSRVAGAVDYEVTVRRAGAATAGPAVHRGLSTGAEYVLPNSLPVGEYLVLVRARGVAAGLASDVRQVAWSVRPLPVAVESFTSGVAAIANGGAVSVTVRDSKLKVLGTFSSLPDLGVFLKNLPAGTYPNVVRTGSVSQVMRFVKLSASPLVSVVGGRLTVAAPVGSGLSSVVETALLLVPNVKNGPLPPVWCRVVRWVTRCRRVSEVARFMCG